MSDDEEPDDWVDYESGPFCQHFSDPSDCDRQCTCGHRCTEHSCGEECNAEGCACEKFRDAPEVTTVTTL